MINNYDSVDTRFSTGSPTSTKQGETSYTGKKRTWLWLIALFVTLFSFVSVQAQTTANYAFSTATTGSLALDANGNSVDMSTGTTQLIGAASDSGASSVTNIGFNYYFYGNPFTQFSVSANGMLQLGSTAVSGTTYVASGGSTTAPKFSPIASDAITASTTDGGGVFSKVVGSAPNRCLVVQWVEYLYYGNTTSPATFQMRLYETTGVIEYVYGAMPVGATAYSSGYSIGFSAGSSANQLACITTSANTVSTSTFTTNAYTAGTSIANLDSSANGSRRVYKFTPPVPASGPTGLTFATVSTTGMTLNWTAAADLTNLVKYVVFNSTNGGTTYNYVNTVALGTNTYAATGLIPGTTYTWKVVAISEGVESTPATGAQATLNGATYYWTGATGDAFATLGKWNTMADGTGTAPTAFAATDVYIIDGDGTTPGGSTTINIGAAVSVGQLKITSNTEVTLQSSTTTTRTITVTGGPGDDFVVESGSTLNLTHATQAAAIVFSGTGNTGLVAGTINFAGSTSNAITTTGGTGTLVTVSGSVINNIAGSSGSITGSVTSLAFTAGSNYLHGSFTTTNGFIPLATWDVASTVTITGGTTSTGITNTTQSFGNFVYNSTTSTATMSVFTSATTAIVQGNLTITATGTGKFRATTSGTVTVNGDLILNGGTFEVSSTSGTVKVLGNVIQNGGRLDVTSGSSTASLLVAGQFNQVAGDLLVSGSSSTNKIEFNGTTAQNVSFAGTTNGSVVFRVNNAAGINLTGTMNINVKGSLIISNGNITGSGSVVYIPTHSYTSAAGATSSTTTITVASTVGLQVGMTVTVSAGVGVFAANTTVTAINTATTFTVSTAPTTALSGGASVVSGTFTGTNTLTYNGAVAQTANSLEFPATNGPASLTINNTATAPNNVVTVPFTRTLVGTAGTLTLTAGILDNSTYVLTVPNTAVAAVSAGSATAYMKGALERSLPASLVTGSTYSFPVGKSGFNPFALVNPLTNAGGTVSVKAEVFDAATGGTNGTLIGALNTNRYWAASITNGSANFTNALVKLSDTPNGADAIASSTTLTGAYSMVGGLTTTATASSLQSTTPEVTTLDGYYVMASKAAATLATPTVTPSGNQCTNVARAISVLITPGGGAITTVVLNYSINGVAQTAINMTNSTNNGALVADTWTATIPTVTPTNATITWSITATDANSLTRSVTGTAYTDEPNLGVSATAAASLATVCAGSPSSLSISFSNAAPSTLYSTPSVTNATTDEDLGNVTITQGATTILNNTSAINSLTGTIGAATGTAGAFSNYTSFGPYAVTAGQTYNFSLSSLQSITAYGNSMAIFIDYNRDGDFADAGENVYAATATTSGAHTETGSFTIPATAFNGKTRMRVICNEGTIASSTPSVSYGEYEDYMLNITSSNVGGGATVATPTAYSWSDGTSVVGTTNPLVVNPTTTTTYTGTATVNGCPITATTTVTVNPLPTAPTATNSTQCGTQIPSASVADTNAFTTPTFKWYDAATAGTVVQSSTSTTFTSSISATTTFYVAVVHPTTGCESPRTAVTVSVSTPDAITATSTATSICIGQSITLTAANSATTPAQTYAYSWLSTANSGVATAQSGASITATPTTVGSYTYTVTAVDGSCQTTATVTVTVNPLPVITTATASPNVACAGSTINLDATVINIQAGATNLGAGASTSSSAGQSFLPGAWGGAKTQYLIRASELTALGYSAGNITSLGFEPTTSGQTYTGFQLWVDQTSTTDLTTTFLPTGTQVYLATGTNDAFTPVANTVNTLAFGTGSGSSSSFNWDGTSNLVVTFSWSSVPSATTSTGSTMKVDAPGFTCTTYKQSDSVTPAAMLASTTGTTGTNRPKFILGGQIATNVTSSYNWTWSIGSTNVLNTASGTTTVPTGATTTYTVTATNIATGCSASQNVTVSTNVAALSMFAIAPQASSICVGETVTMFANPTGGCIPYTYSWSDGTSVVGTAATLAVTPTSDKTYTLTITDNAGTQLVKTATVTVNNPQPASVAGQTICANSSAFTLSATESTPGNLLNWYAAQTGGSVLASGSTFTTPSISATTTYYVEENALGAVNAGLGRASTTATTSTTPSTYGLVFNLNVKSKLNSVDVYLASATAGNLVVQLQNSTGAVINSKTIAVPAGNATTPVQYTVPLDFIIPAGTGYRLLAISGTSMVRESALGGFPYSLSYFGDITSGYISGTSTSYYFFYNWSLSDICTGLRVPVTATLNIPPSITLSGASDTICNGQATTTAVTVATGGSSYDVYTWSPITGVTGNSSTGWTFNPTSSTTYTLTASQSAGTCSTTATYVVNVNPTPSAITIAPAAPAVCVNSIQALTVTGGTVGSTVNVGTATTTNATTAYPSPFTNYYGGAKHQMLIKASELTALGLMPNIPIQSLSFEVTAVGSTFTGTLQNFQVDMASTSATVLTSTAFLPATTNVRAAADLPVAVGVVTIPLNGQFAWDGVSNIVIQTSYSNTNSGTSTDFVQMKNSDPGFVSTNWYRADSVTAASILAATTPSSSGNARPNMVLDNSASTNITWSPTTNLYTNAAATTPYTGGYATTVYVKSATAATTTYTVSSVTSTGCSASGTVTVTVNALPTVATVNPAPVCAPATIDLTASAVTTGSETGLTFTYFTDSAATTALATPSAVATSGTYYIKGTNANGCSVVMPVTVTINLLPTVTTVAPATVCYPSTVDLTASAVTTGSDSGLTYTYFTDSAATTVLTNPNAVTTSGTYYIKGTNANGCSSIASVVVTINVTNAPTGTASQTFCGSANLSQLVVTGSNIRWYNAATGGTEYPASLWSLVGLVNGTTYYATQTVNGCESTTRLAVTAVINTIPSAPNASAQDFCSAPTVSQLLPNGSSINWYSASTGGTPLASTDILSANTYYVSQTINGCESTRTPVTITITALPAPTGATTQTVFGGVAADATIEDISVSGTNVIWYPTAADAAAGTNAIAAGTQLVDGSTYYAVSVIGSCRSNALAVTVTVTLDNRTFDLENLKFYPNPVVDQLTIVYTKEITSIQIYNLNGQLVKVVQPNATNVQVDMTELSTAMYIVKVYAEDKSAELKVYKK
jgi:hypothetical protein